jgi:sulfur carrier protein
MKITVNGQPREVASTLTLTELLTEQLGTTRGSAAAVDGEVVPRTNWPTFTLADGQAVELITAVQGG